MSTSYPAEIWDGDSGNRDSDDGTVRAPDHRDWDRLMAELAAAQTQMGVGSNADAVAAVGTVGTSVTEVSERATVQRTILTLTDLAITCAEGGTKEYGSSLLHTFPAGAIKVLGITLDVTITSSDYSGVEEGDLALGEIAATDRALTGDDVTWLAAAALTFGSGTVTVTAQDDIVAIEDGTSSAKEIYLNLCMDQGGGTGDVVVNGTATVTWINLGDY